MDQLITRRLILSLSLPLAALVAFTSAVGLWYPSIYAAATPNWTFQTIGQDAVDLFLIVPMLIFSALYACNNRRPSLAMWGGTNMYLVYTFIIYSFDVRFNDLFVLYCFILGLASFSTGIFLYKTVKDGDTLEATSGARRFIGYFFIVISVVFYLTWLSDILPAIIEGGVPTSIHETGLFTNPVYVLDLAILLPLVFIVGILTLKGNSFALNLAPVLLIFFILMNITIAALALVLYRQGIEESYSVSIVMGILAAISVAATIVLFNKTEVIKNARIWTSNQLPGF
jgi:hypothetical protein